MRETIDTYEHVGRAVQMREEFDRAFGEAARSDVTEPINLLSIRLGGDPFAIRISETAGLFSDRKVTPVPSSVREFRGVAGIRGAIVPVFHLAGLLGYSGAPGSRWIVVARDAMVAFAIDAFEGQLRVDSVALVAHEASTREHVREVVRTPDLSRPIVHLPSVLVAIRGRAAAAGLREEKQS